MAIFDHTMQFKLLTLSQHYNYSRQGVSRNHCQCFHGLSFQSKYENSLLITHYSLLGIQTPIVDLTIVTCMYNAP